MEKEFKRINPAKIDENFIKLIGLDWMLIASGHKDNHNTMTAAWGGAGFLWNTPVTFIFVRPERFTYQFTEKYDFYTLNFFDNKYKDILNYCGTHSGKDVNKAKECNLTVLQTNNSCVYFKEARLIIECRKIYFEDIKQENFIDKNFLTKFYKDDFHRIYFGEITGSFVNRT